MGIKYICEVRRDYSNKELELVKHKDFHTVATGGLEGAIKFKNDHDFHKYFKKYCISEDELKSAESGSSIFMFLFWMLLLIFIITLVFQSCNNGSGQQVSSTAFGRFWGSGFRPIDGK